MNADKHGYQYLQDYLTRNEFRYKEPDNLMVFKVEGERYLCNKTEAPALQIYQAYGMPELERQEILEIVNAMNKGEYVIKYYADFDLEAILCCLELIPDETFTDEYWELSLKMLKYGSDKFEETCKSITED